MIPTWRKPWRYRFLFKKKIQRLALQVEVVMLVKQLKRMVYEPVMSLHDNHDIPFHLGPHESL